PAAPAAASSSASSSPAVTSSSSSTGWTLFARAGFIDGEGTSLELVSAECLDRRLGRFRSLHSDERKAAGPAAHAVEHEIDFGHRTVLGKQILEVVFSDAVGQIAYKQFGAHLMS